MARPRWWQLPSGTLWFGRGARGGVPCDPPSAVVAEAGQEDVDAGDSGPQVDAVALVDEQPPEDEEVVDGPVEVVSAGEEADGEAEVVGQESKATARRPRKATKGD